MLSVEVDSYRVGAKLTRETVSAKSLSWVFAFATIRLLLILVPPVSKLKAPVNESNRIGEIYSY